MNRKQRIPKALREQVWLKTNKQKFKVKCPISWCNNEMSLISMLVILFPNLEVEQLQLTI
jgi:hypothetical protein